MLIHRNKEKHKLNVTEKWDKFERKIRESGLFIRGREDEELFKIGFEIRMNKITSKFRHMDKPKLGSSEHVDTLLYWGNHENEYQHNVFIPGYVYGIDIQSDSIHRMNDIDIKFILRRKLVNIGSYFAYRSSPYLTDVLSAEYLGREKINDSMRMPLYFY